MECSQAIIYIGQVIEEKLDWLMDMSLVYYQPNKVIQEVNLTKTYNLR